MGNGTIQNIRLFQAPLPLRGGCPPPAEEFHLRLQLAGGKEQRRREEEEQVSGFPLVLFLHSNV